MLCTADEALTIPCESQIFNDHIQTLPPETFATVDDLGLLKDEGNLLRILFRVGSLKYLSILSREVVLRGVKLRLGETFEAQTRVHTRTHTRTHTQT